MYVCIYTNVYVYICIRTYVYVCIHMHIMCVYTHMYTHTCAYIHIWNMTGLSAVTLFNLYNELIMRNTGLDELQAGAKIVGRNISNLRNADDTTLMTESEEELNSLLMRVKEESERARLKLNIKKKKKN